MKTFFRFSLLAIATAMFGLIGCSKSDVTPIDEKEKAVFIKIEGGSDAALSRSDASPASEETVTFNSGELYFTDAAGAITLVVSLDATAINKITDTGHTISNVPGSSTNIYLFGNVPSGVTLPVLGYVKSVQDVVYEVASQSNQEGSLKNASLEGIGNITYTGDKGTSSFKIYPMISRIELAGMTAQGEISAFNVQGIFINNYYGEVAAKGAPVATSLVNNTKDIENYGGSANKYDGKLKNVVADYVDYTTTEGLGKLEGLTYKPNTVGNVWAYNIITPAINETEVSAEDYPHIVVRLNNIELSDGAIEINEPRFLTITEFKSAGEIVPIEKGKIYRIAADVFKFKEDEITVTPEEESVDVDVTIELIKWVAVDIDEITVN